MVQICWICSMLHLTRSCLSQWWRTITSSSSMLSSSCTTMASVTVTSRLKTASWTAAHSVSRYNSPSAAAQCYQPCWQSWQPPRYQVPQSALPVSKEFMQNSSDASTQRAHAKTSNRVLRHICVETSHGIAACHALHDTDCDALTAVHCRLVAAALLLQLFYCKLAGLILQTCYCSLTTAACLLQTCHCRFATADSLLQSHDQSPMRC